jgi:flagellar protein FlbT
MYISSDAQEHHPVYFALIREILQAAPSTWTYIADINNHILTGAFYKALKDAKKLIAYEQELLNHAKRGASLRSGSETDRESA